MHQSKTGKMVRGFHPTGASLSSDILNLLNMREPFEKGSLLAKTMTEGVAQRGFDECILRGMGTPWRQIEWRTVKSEPKGKPAIEEITKVCRELAERMEKLERAVVELSEITSCRPVTRLTFIYELGDGEFKLREPVPVTIEEYEGEFLAKVPELECFGSAETEGEAICSLKRELVSLYTDLAATPTEQLGRLPKTWLRVLNRLVEKV